MVDDEPDLTMLFKLGLEDNGFESSHCTECLQGEPSSYELALIDIRMPEMNGFQLYNEMKK
jgi:DNA-binding response OmpR family regulator